MNKLITLFCTSLILLASSSASAGTQQDKMKSCNREAKTRLLSGDERKTFMKNCLSSKTAAAGIPKLTAATKQKKSSPKRSADTQAMESAPEPMAGTPDSP